MIKVICVGKLKEKASSALVAEYSKRIGLYTKFEMTEVNDEKTKDNATEKEIKQILDAEAKRVLEKIKPDDYVILVDLHGEMMTSEAFARKIDKLYTNGSSSIVFVIGGSMGIGDELRKRSNEGFKMSDLTFPHQICRILLTEQIYRAFTIIHNTPYHK